MYANRFLIKVCHIFNPYSHFWWHFDIISFFLRWIYQLERHIFSYIWPDRIAKKSTMSKYDEKILFYKKNMTSMGLVYEDELFDKITRGLGPSIFKRDAASVSTSDEKEIFTVKHNFLINKLGLDDGVYLDDAINKVSVVMGKTNRVKYRAIFYYLLVKELGQEYKVLNK